MIPVNRQMGFPCLSAPIGDILVDRQVRLLARTDDIAAVNQQMGLINSNYPVVKQEIYIQGVMLVISININDNINNTIQCILISM